MPLARADRVVHGALAAGARSVDDGTLRCKYCDCEPSCRYRDGLQETADLVAAEMGVRRPPDRVAVGRPHRRPVVGPGDRRGDPGARGCGTKRRWWSAARASSPITSRRSTTSTSRRNRRGRGGRARVRAHADAERRSRVLRRARRRSSGRSWRRLPLVKLDHLERQLDPAAAAAAARAARASRARRRVPAGDQGRGRRCSRRMELDAAGYESRHLRPARVQRRCHPVAGRAWQTCRVGFDSDPVPEQSRVLAARAGEVDVVCVYVVNGKAVGDPAYETKLAWLDALRAWLAATYDPAAPLVSRGTSTSRPTTATSGIRSSGATRTSRAIRNGNASAGAVDWGLTDLGRARGGRRRRARSRTGTTRPGPSTRGGGCGSTWRSDRAEVADSDGRS